MTKKRSSEISADENQEIFPEKVKFWKFSSESQNFSKIGGNLKQGGNASWSQGGMDVPGSTHPNIKHLIPSLQLFSLGLASFHANTLVVLGWERCEVFKQWCYINVCTAVRLHCLCTWHQFLAFLFRSMIYFISLWLWIRFVHAARCRCPPAK